MAAVLLVLFAVTFLFDTRLGFCFLAAAIVKLYLGATSPIETGYVTGVTLSGDGKRLFASYAGVGYASPAAFLSAADTALYAAKHAGRNQVHTAPTIPAA